MKLEGMRIATQLKLGLGFIMVFVIALAAVAYVQTDQLWQQTRGLYEHPFMVRRAIGQLDVDVLTIHRAMKDLVLADNEAEKQSLIHTIEISEEDAFRQIEVLYERYLGPRSDIEQTHGGMIEWKAIRDETIRLLQAGRSAEAIQRTKKTGVGGAQVEKLRSHINKISDFAQNRADQFYRDAEVLNSSLHRQLGAIVTVILLLSLLISWLLWKGIRSPLAELTAAADHFRKGELQTRSGYVSSNEFGKLSAAFNALAETVQGEWQRREAAARIAEIMLQEEDLHAFCRELLKGLMDRTGSQMGAVYLLNEARTAFEHFESIGLSSIGRASFAAAELEGEFGAALATGQIQRVSDIPADSRFTFATVAGEFQPRELITIPLRGAEGIAAIVSLAGLSSYSEAALKLVNDLWHVLTARFNGVLAAAKIRAFAERIEQQNEELQQQAEELQQQAEELQEQNVELEQQRQFLEEASRLKSQFLSNMSHELRTPLNSVMALSRVLLMQARDKLSPEEAGYLEVIERNGKNLLTLINDILDLAKIEAGRLEVHPKRFSLLLTIDNLLESIAPMAAEKGIELRRQLPAELPLVESDEVRVTQVLQNLVGNAVKFTDAGSVTVSAREHEGTVCIEVSDTGIGIAAQDLASIFDEFRQVDGSAARRYQGTGLGLSIARKAARMLGGEISVWSTPGQGSTFTLSMPVDWPGGTQPEAGPEGGQGPRLKPGCQVVSAAAERLQAAQPTTILLVEDSEPAIVQVRAVLTAAGFEVHVARDGQEAVEFVSRTIPDGIILDLMMPGIDGFAVLERLRAMHAGTTIPVLILTAKDLTAEDLTRLSANRISQLVQKGDVDKESLLRKVRSMLATTARQLPPTANAGDRGAGDEEAVPASQRQREGPDCPTVGLGPAADDLSGRSLTGVMPDPSGPEDLPLVLVVEDNPDSMLTIKAVLKGRCRIVEATDGETCLRMAEEAKPDLILLDMALPRMDGHTAVRRLRDNAELARIPVIALTARVMKGDREKIIEAGCDDYIAKPIDPESCLQKIEAWLKQ